MSKNQNITPADLAAKAAAEGVVIPTQPDEKVPAEVTEEQNTDAKVVNEDGESTKKSLKDRLGSVTAKLKANKKNLALVGAAAAVATVAFLKYAKKKVEDEILEVVEVEPIDEAEGPVIGRDDSAA